MISRRLFFAMLGARPAFGQDGLVIRTEVALVRIDAEVFGNDGVVITGLTKEDFRIFDGGVEQPISSVSFEKDPLDLILLFDHSGSMKGKILSLLRAVELGFHELKFGDRVCVMTYPDRGSTATLLPFTADLDVVNQTLGLRLPGLPFNGQADSVRAADDAALRFRSESQTGRRRAVLLVSDKPVAATNTSTLYDLWQSDAVLGELALGSSGRTRIAEADVNSLAARTGGAIVLAGEPGSAFQQSVSLLRRRYTIYYPLPQNITGATGRADERSVDLRLSSEGLNRSGGARIRARTGYVMSSVRK